MLKRYTVPEMQHLWSDENKFSMWLKVELAVIQARVGHDLTFEAWKLIERNIKFDVGRIEELEKIYEHDLIAFVECIQESLRNTEAEKWASEIHKGLTSYDVEDTAMILMLRQSWSYIAGAVKQLADSLRNKAYEHRNTLMIARTHGQFAEPDTFGRLLKVFEQAIERSYIRLENVLSAELSEGKISGAVGNYGEMDPHLEEKALGLLGLTPACSETQILQRDRHAVFISTLSVLAATIGQMAKTFWQMMRSDVGELQEPRKPKQRGSSAMAHKRNPIKTEQLFGLSRLLRAYAMAATEDIETIECREISQSSVERHIFPDATSLALYMARRATDLVDGLIVFKERMAENLERTYGVWASQRIRNALMWAGVPYSVAYETVQRACFESTNSRRQLRVVLSESFIDGKPVIEIISKFDLDKSFNAFDYIWSGVSFVFGD